MEETKNFNIKPELFEIRRTSVEEAEEILAVQKEAFNDDLMLYKDYETNPATEPIKRLLYKINKNFHYTIIYDNKIIGGAEVRIGPEDECYINRIFLKPEYQNKGLGTQIMDFIESEFKGIKRWTLNTTHKNLRNRHFYEKRGYMKVGERKITESLSLIDYLKESN